MISIFFLIFVLTILYLYEYSKNKPTKFPPGPPRLPLWGNYWFLLREDYYFTHRSTALLAQRYNTNILGLYLRGPTVITCDYESCKEVLTREEFYGRETSLLSLTRSRGVTAGIFFLDGIHWQQQRRFALRHLRDYGFGRRFDRNENFLENDIRDLIEMFTSDPTPKNQDVCRKKGQVLMPDIFFGPLANFSFLMLIGKRLDNEFIRMLMNTSIMIFLRSLDAIGGALAITPWLRYIAPKYFGYDIMWDESARVYDFFQAHIKEHKYNITDDHYMDLIDSYLSQMQKFEQNGEKDTGFTERQLTWTLIDFMFPAPATVGHTLHFLWSYLLKYPKIQYKIQEEIDRVVGRSRLPNLDDRKNMPYTEAVIREVMRMDPVLPLGVPRRTLVNTTLQGHFIPKDTIVIANLYCANHDPKIWNDPNTFKPERFLDNNGHLLKKDLSIQFGGGKRLCVGETFSRHAMFLLLSGLLQNFTFKPTDDTPDPNNKQFGFIYSIPDYWMNAERKPNYKVQVTKPKSLIQLVLAIVKVLQDEVVTKNGATLKEIIDHFEKYYPTDGDVQDQVITAIKTAIALGYIYRNTECKFRVIPFSSKIVNTKLQSSSRKKEICRVEQIFTKPLSIGPTPSDICLDVDDITLENED
ncbi:hypothetical protein RN001_004416 [Aquatica leii]|uniref:Cytochrome P450 n=1 Tax=Aquatica leii TaxID=1421715 RepID=A0AAN7PAN5_9COLE|nr:hypothetical protein RN001_004416 [Aquatica leii]